MIPTTHFMPKDRVAVRIRDGVVSPGLILGASLTGKNGGICYTSLIKDCSSGLVRYVDITREDSVVALIHRPSVTRLIYGGSAGALPLRLGYDVDVHVSDLGGTWRLVSIRMENYPPISAPRYLPGVWEHLASYYEYGDIQASVMSVSGSWITVPRLRVSTVPSFYVAHYSRTRGRGMPCRVPRKSEVG